MTLETVALIGVLTLLTLNLGADVFWLVVVSPALQQIDDQSLFTIVSNIYTQALILMPAIFLIALVCAILLNFVPKSRSEPYLLKIGLATLIAYALIVGLGTFPISNSVLSLDQLESVKGIRQVQERLDMILWFRFPVILVSYWSFMHYALNPKVQSN
ncbi:MAG: hypothetical protein AAF282_00845 [Cyanobacteria bacterium P01_A01_bin.15]